MRLGWRVCTNASGNPSFWSAVNGSIQNNNDSTGNPSIWSAVNRSKQNNNKSTGNPSFWSAVTGRTNRKTKAIAILSLLGLRIKAVLIPGDWYPAVPSGSSRYTEEYLTSKEQWEELKQSGKLLYNQVPLLEIDGLELVQTGAIVRYLAKKYNMYGSNEQEAVK
ncbi:GST [Mytilus coruscus]|uniref:GST n=1 Tax=Mytilus coruscus TaxID=42192 RepID=A0A6J8D5R1_MYTCO|nr:GST [Mytilus coruscus]